ncbi:thioredoxin family protein [Myroides sp. LJL116]
MKKITLSICLVALFGALTSCKDQATQKEQDTPIEIVKDNELSPEELEQKRIAQEKAKQEREGLSKPYNETEDAQQKINELLVLAKEQNKNIFVQAGGNWCIWCLRFNDFVQKDPELKSIVDENYLYYHLNYSPKNKNKEVFDKYAPGSQSLGYPFFFVITPDSQEVAVITSGELEDGKSYDKQKVKQLFLDNAPKK